MAYPDTATLVAASSVEELTGLTTEQQDSLRAAAIVAVESYCCQPFTDFPAETVDVEAGGGYELYLPKRLRVLTSVTPYGGDPLEEAALGVDPEGDRIVFHQNVVGTGYYSQALYEVSGGDYPTCFPLGTLQITGDWGWEDPPDAVVVALRYDMEEQALADQNALSSTVHAVRKLGLANIGQGSLRAELVTPPLVSPRVEALLRDYLWHGEAGKLV